MGLCLGTHKTALNEAWDRRRVYVCVCEGEIERGMSVCVCDLV